MKSNVVGEAMACGNRMVTTGVGDSSHVAGNVGTVVEKCNPIALAYGIEETLGKDRDQSGIDGRNRIVKNFSISTMVAKTDEALSALLNES